VLEFGTLYDLRFRFQPMPLPLDGERLVPGESTGNIELDAHSHRYLFASQFGVSGKVVMVRTHRLRRRVYASALMGQRSARRCRSASDIGRAVWETRWKQKTVIRPENLIISRPAPALPRLHTSADGSGRRCGELRNHQPSMQKHEAIDAHESNPGVLRPECLL